MANPGPTPSPLASLRARVVDALRFHPRELVALAVLGALLTGGAAIAYVRARPAPAETMTPVASPSAVQAAARIVVHVVGSVQRPGVYRFAEGARVYDAVRAAGGFARGADRAAINLARPLVDGEQIVVPARGAAPPGGSSRGSQSSPGGAAGSGGKVNINIAGPSELESLPGIGPALAQRIVDYRTQHGPFRDVRDLMKVPGIGEKKFASLEPHVTV